MTAILVFGLQLYDILTSELSYREIVAADSVSDLCGDSLIQSYGCMSNALRRIASLKNLGPKSARQIVAAGIDGPDEIRELGAAEVFYRVKSRFPASTSLNLLWAVQGALMEVHWHDVPYEIKHQLLVEVEDLQPR